MHHSLTMSTLKILCAVSYLLLIVGPNFAFGVCRMKHDRAARYLQRIGISLMSHSGLYGCKSRGCVSLEKIRCDTLNGLAKFKQASGCSSVVIVGGTEESGPPGHKSGHSLSISNSPCVASFIKHNFYLRGAVYVDGAGNSYTPTDSATWNLYYQ